MYIRSIATPMPVSADDKLFRLKGAYGQPGQKGAALRVLSVRRLFLIPVLLYLDTQHGQVVELLPVSHKFHYADIDAYKDLLR